MRKYIDGDEGVVPKINEILERCGLNELLVIKSVHEDKVKTLARSYAVRDYDAIKEVDELLAAEGLNVHEVTVKPMMERIEELQRIDHLVASAESRRNTALHEIDRKWSRLGAPLRRSIEAQDAEFEVIQSEGKTST